MMLGEQKRLGIMLYVSHSFHDVAANILISKGNIYMLPLLTWQSGFWQILAVINVFCIKFCGVLCVLIS